MNSNYQNQYYQMYYNNPNQNRNQNFNYRNPNNYNFYNNQNTNTNNYNPYITNDMNNINSMENQLKNMCLNKNVKEFVPKNKNISESENFQNQNNKPLNLNLGAREFIPKTFNNINDNYQIEDQYLEQQNEFLDNEINNYEMNSNIKQSDHFEAMETFIDGDESDKEIWVPKFQECECCQGFVYKCKGPACLNMRECYCKATDEYDLNY